MRDTDLLKMSIYLFSFLQVDLCENHRTILSNQGMECLSCGEDDGPPRAFARV
jgi:hypothetical protein